MIINTAQYVKKLVKNCFYVNGKKQQVGKPRPTNRFISSVRSSNSHPDLIVTHPTFSDHTGPQHWTFTF